ncbi:MAG: 4-(cytidine 5'-diphospho)-2-C-methyl-D-erythritol kinase, partial [Thermoanaerobaculia bacterium]
MQRTQPIEVHAHAKINWMLRILGKRADGFHELETIFQSISLRDTLRIHPGEPLSLACDDPTIPADGSNLVMRAAQA